MAYLKKMKTVLLGKTGYGKSSCGNTILGGSTREKFCSTSSSNSVTTKIKVLTGLREGTESEIEIIDTPGFFDTALSDEQIKPEILKCIVTCAPGPHAFIIVLRVERYTEQEKAAVAKITKSFGKCAFKFSVILFTHGDDLDEGQTIEQFAYQNKELKELMDKCGGRCHVIDNKYWNQEHEYRSNRVQVEKLLNTIEEMVRQNGGVCYTNRIMKVMDGVIQREEEEIRKLNPNEEAVIIRTGAIERVVNRILPLFASVTVEALGNALLGIGVVAGTALMIVLSILGK